MKKLISFIMVILLAGAACFAALGAKEPAGKPQAKNEFRYEIQPWLPLAQFEKYRGLFTEHSPD